jgi:hypothetical protein
MGLFCWNGGDDSGFSNLLIKWSDEKSELFILSSVPQITAFVHCVTNEKMQTNSTVYIRIQCFAKY